MRTKTCILSLFASLLAGLASHAAEVRGIVVRADTDKNQLIIEGRGLGVRGAILTFHLDKDTQILAGRKPVAVADLSPGRRVRVTYELQGERRVALLITLLGAQPSPTPPAATPGGGNNVSGVLRRVNLTEREIVVVGPANKGEGESETSVWVPEDATITRDQKAVSFDDLKEGEQVLVQVEKRDGRLTAKSIQLGIVANANPNPEPKPFNIEKIRRGLKMLDFLLQMIDQKSK